MKKFLGFLLILIVIAAVAASMFLPNFVSSQLEARLNDSLHPSTTSLKIDSSPSLKMLLGKVDTFRGDLEGVKLGDLEFADIHFDIDNMEIDPFQLLLAKHVVVSKVGDGEIEGVVTQAALEEFLTKKIKGFDISSVTIDSNALEVKGEINIGGFIKGDAVAKGTLEVKNNSLMFAPERFYINGMNIGGLTSAVLKEVVVYDFANFPIPVQADRVETTDQEIHVFIKPLAK